MVLEKELLGLSEVAEVCNVSKNVISNWRKRDDSFPTPYQENTGGPIWKTEDIVQYLAIKDAYYDAITSPGGYLKTFRIALIGRARDGKTYLISRFAKNREEFIELFCGGGSDETFCVVNNYISEECKLEFLEFHTDFNSIYKAEDEDIKLKELNNEISSVINKKIELEDVELAQEKLAKIKTLSKRMSEMEEQYSGRKKSNTFINVYLMPSDYGKDILRSTQSGRIEMIDTPGVSGDVEPSNIEKSDFYVFVLKPENMKDAQTIKKIVTKIKPDVAVSKVVFLYRKEKNINNIQKYEKAKDEVKENMRDFNSLFEEFKGNIVNTDLELLDPAANSILYPTMDDEDIILTEELFMKEFCDKLKEFQIDKDSELLEQFQEVVKVYQNEAIELVKSIFTGIELHKLYDGKEAFTEDDFKSESHDRVMTNDNYRLLYALRSAYRRESILLDNYFSRFLPEDYPEKWQQTVIKYVYHKMMKSIRTDRGLGIGTHPFEEKPARTMLVEESILASDVVNKVDGRDKISTNDPYRKALQQNGITSKTWGYVGCSDSKEALTKLKIVMNTMLKIPTSSRENLVLARYIGGLRKIAEFAILQECNLPDEDCLKEVEKLPF